jgi:hypothetical protein
VNDESIQPLAPKLAALLAAERRAPAPSAARRAHILARLEPLIGAGGAGGTPPAASTSALASKFFLVASAAAVLAIGGAVAVSRRPPAVPIAPLASTAVPIDVAVVPPRAPSAPPRATVLPSAEPNHTLLRRRPRATAPAERADFDLSNLREEAAILERGRRELTSGDPSAALGTIADAQRRFPRGFLIEERAALEIRALAAAGYRTTACARAAAFNRDFPASIQAAAIADALRDEVADGNRSPRAIQGRGRP